MNRPFLVSAGSAQHGLPGRGRTGTTPAARPVFMRKMRAARGPRRRAFTLAEILVVVAILALLIGVVYKGGSVMLNNAKARDTEALIKTLMAAVEAYKLEANDNNIPNFKRYYMGNPPDSLAVFTSAGLAPQGCGVSLSLVRSTSAQVVGDPNNAFFADQRNAQGKLNPLARSAMKYGDIRALVLAIRLRSPKGSEILDRIDPRFKVSGSAEGAFYDPGDGTDPIGLDYYADAWGTPLEYYSLCTCDGDPDPRRKATRPILHINNGQPLIVSYGPNGADQLSADFIDTYSDSTIVADMFEDGLINHELNHDNVYSDPVILDRLRRGGP